MAENVKVAILFGFGINCDRETAAVFELAGATVKGFTLTTLLVVKETFPSSIFWQFQEGFHLATT